jgi:hypothetical protein
MRRYFSKGSNVIGPKDINKNGQIESWEEARAEGMAEGMGKEYVDRAKQKKADLCITKLNQEKWHEKAFGTTFNKKENVVLR